jgi:hypothetical protein
MRSLRFFAAAAALVLCIPECAHAQQPDAAKSKKPDLPLSVGRHVNFTATKGSWMSLDVSPDRLRAARQRA